MEPTVERRPAQVRHPGVDNDLPAAPLAHVEYAGQEPARTGDEGAPGLDGKTGRTRVLGQSIEQAWPLAREALGSRRQPAGRDDRDPATNVERVERLERAPQE